MSKIKTALALGLTLLVSLQATFIVGASEVDCCSTTAHEEHSYHQTDDSIAPAASCTHNFNGSFETTKNPTCTQTGTKVGKCTKCGVILTTVGIPATGHSWTYIPGGAPSNVQICSTCRATRVV